MYSFGKRSQEQIDTLCLELQKTLGVAIRVVNFSVVCGFRPKEEQNSLYDQRLTKLRWPDGKHNKNPSDAVDIYPWVSTISGVKVNTMLTGHPKQISELSEKVGITYDKMYAYVMEQFALMVGAVMAAGAALGYVLRSGSDWDRDGDRLDQSFHDLCHVEVVR